jgi:ATPase subunit of ABC transporter with duplicated ATPase domains
MSILLGGDGLTAVLPDGTPLFTDLHFHFDTARTGLIGRNGAGKSTLLRMLAGQIPPTAGQVVASGRVTLLEQDAGPAAYCTVADAFGVRDLAARYQRVMQGDGTPEDLDRLAGHWDLHERIEAALTAVGMDGLELGHPYGLLSGGEQTRVRFARLLYEQPDIALLDEPTNHLDRTGRRFVLDWMESWKGGLVVASHDRELLDTMYQVALLDERGLHLYGGNYTFYEEQSALERAAAEQALQHARNSLGKAREQAQRARERQEQRQASGKRSARRTGVGKMAIGAMRRHAENSSGKLKDRHADKVAGAAEAVQLAKESVLEEGQIAVDLSFTAVPARKRMVDVRHVNVRFSGADLWPEPLTITVTGPERVALKGRNGSGKSTLLRLIDETLTPSTGEVVVGARRVAMLDQQVALLDPDRTLLENAARLAPARPEQEVRLLLNRFLFDRLTVDKKVRVLSGGERMRAGLCGLLCQDQAPDLLLLDEPTNNLDLNSVQKLASVLNRYQGALIVVSHDERFLKDVGVSRTVELEG